MSRYGVFSGPYFPVFGLNTEIYTVNLRIQSKYRKYGPEKTPYLDTFHTVSVFVKASTLRSIFKKTIGRDNSL